MKHVNDFALRAIFQCYSNILRVLHDNNIYTKTKSFTQIRMNLFHNKFTDTDNFKRVHWMLSVKERQSRNAMFSTIRFDVYLIRVQVVGFQGRLSVLTEPLYYPFTAPFSTATRISSLLCTRLRNIKRRLGSI